ncbi:MAG TPA: hypothetical protein VK937_15070 [Candidatus Limnocylindria bacterium]|nr:hypothetical protein [Candidatus Limnocylindria bacterium]
MKKFVPPGPKVTRAPRLNGAIRIEDPKVHTRGIDSQPNGDAPSSGYNLFVDKVDA